jgi:DNA repair photolyase
MKERKSKCSLEKIPTGTKEWADHNVNCIKGCYNNCRYCYAMLMAKRFGRATNNTWKKMTIREDVVNTKFRKFSGRVMFPSSHDIFDMPDYENACFTVLENLLKSSNEVLVTTKPRLAIIKKIDREFSGYKEQIQFRFTITSSDDQLLKFWEPNAPLLEERLKSLQYAFKKGYKTSVSIEPFLDFDPKPLVEIISPYVTESIWLGIMNYIPRNNVRKAEISYYDSIRKNYSEEHLREIFEIFNECPKIRWKDSIKTKLNLPGKFLK